MRELPQKFNIEEEPSLFDENSNSFESDSRIFVIYLQIRRNSSQDYIKKR